MRTLSVSAEEAVAQSVRAVLGSLPRSFTATSSPTAEVIVVGGGAGWPERALRAVKRGPQSIMVLRPGFESPLSVRRLAEASSDGSVPIMLAEPWTCPSAVDAFAREHARQRLDPAVLVECVASLDAAPREVFLAQLRLMRVALGCGMRIDSFTSTGSAFLISGETLYEDAAEPLLVVGNVRDRVAARLRRLSAHGESELCVYDGDLAAPATGLVADAISERRFPLVYESGHRTAWRRLRTSIDRAQSAPAEHAAGVQALRLLADDLDIVAELPW